MIQEGGREREPFFPGLTEETDKEVHNCHWLMKSVVTDDAAEKSHC